MNNEIKNVIKYLILIIIKNIDEGDGASLKMINAAFIRLLRIKKIGDVIHDDFVLFEEIQTLFSENYISENSNSNYYINHEGIDFIKTPAVARLLPSDAYR